MASKAAIAKKRLDAVAQINAAAGVLSEKLSIDAPNIAQGSNRDPELKHANELTILADWVQALSERVQNSLFVPMLDEPFPQYNLDAMTVKELRDLADELDVELASNMRKDDIIAALQEADITRYDGTISIVSTIINEDSDPVENNDIDLSEPDLEVGDTEEFEVQESE